MGKQWKRASKLKQDLQKGALFTRLAKEIKTAVLESGADPESNSRLRLALKEAKQKGLPGDTIQRAIKNAAQGSGLFSEQDTLLYEGYGPHGVAVMVQCVGDNPVRTVARVRNWLKRHGGKLGESGCLNWMFKRVGVVKAGPPSSKTGGETDFTDMALEAGANDFILEKTGEVCFYVGEQDIKSAEAFLKNNSWTIIKTYIGYRANDYMDSKEEQREDIEKFISDFENCEDCLNIFTNLKPRGAG